MSSTASRNPSPQPSQWQPDLPPGALAELLRASLCSQELGEDPWEFALSLHELHQAGLHTTELRWLVHEGHVEHRMRYVGPGGRGSRFRRTRKLHFTEQSYFLLTATGVALAQRLGTAGRGDPGGPVPTWDRKVGQLLLVGAVVKRFRRVAGSQYAVLDAFQKQGWPADIANPLPDDADRYGDERLGDALRKLNQGQQGPRIRFHVLLRGQRVSWECLPETEQGQC